MSEEKTQVQNARKDLDILNKMKNLPGGLVIIPLVIAVVLATFVPQVFQIGGYVTALFYEGNACMMGFFLIVCGSMIDIKQVGMPLYKGVIMTGTKFLLGVIVGLVVGKICGPEGFLGIAPFVLIATITNSNGSLYISLSSQFGNATDTGAISILSLNDGPFFTLIALGATGLANIPIKSLIAVLVPLLIGFIWGNLDKGFRDACKNSSADRNILHDHFHWCEDRYQDNPDSRCFRYRTWTDLCSNSSYLLLRNQPSSSKEGKKCDGCSHRYNSPELSYDTCCSCRS